MIRIYLLFFLFISSFYLTSCYPNGPEDPSELDAVITNYDPSFSFKGKKTFFLPDTVQETDTTIKQPRLPLELNNFIVGKIASNLFDRGFTRLDTIDNNHQPDFIVTASFINTNYSGTTYYTYPGYGSGYWGSYYGWGAGWGYYTPYYPVTYSYNTGTIFIEIINPSGADITAKQIPVVWRAEFNGILTDLNDLKSRLDKYIDQAFIQSPQISF